MRTTNELKRIAQNYATNNKVVVAFLSCGNFVKEPQKHQIIEEWIYPKSIVGYICYVDAKSKAPTYPTLETVEKKEQRFWCKDCYLPCNKSILVGNDGVPVYRVNIGIYSQVCDSCGKLVVDGVKKSSKHGEDRQFPLCLFGSTA